MAIYANPDYFEREQDGHIEQVLVAVRYVGPSRWFSNPSTATQGRWPTGQNFLVDQWYVAFVPESTPDGDPGEGIAWFERSPAFEVEYDPEAIAAVLVDNNLYEEQPGGPIGDGESVPGFPERVRDALGLEDPVTAGASDVEQLKALAGAGDGGPERPDPVEEFVSEYDRTELKDVVKATREDTDHFNLRGKSMRDMAEFLVEEGVEP